MPYHVVITYNCNLNCSYCYAKGLKYEQMDINSFNKALDWFEKQGIRNISLIGGEPTLHPDFEEMLDIIERRNFRTVLFTNGLMSAKVADKINPKIVSSIIMNYNVPESYSEKQKELLDENIKVLRKKISRVTLSFNIDSDKTPYKYLVDACLKYNISRIRFSIATPNICYSNKYFDLNSIKNMIPNLLKFVKLARKNNIKLVLARPLPLCVFDRKEKEFLKKNNLLMSTCAISKGVFVINPDLSVFPCTTLQIKGPHISTLKNRFELIKYYAKTIDDLKWNHYIFPECKMCIYRLRKKCSAVCLSYKL